jgi:Flp pilus assembly protein TadD
MRIVKMGNTFVFLSGNKSLLAVLSCFCCISACSGVPIALNRQGGAVAESPGGEETLQAEARSETQKNQKQVDTSSQKNTSGFFEGFKSKSSVSSAQYGSLNEAIAGQNDEAIYAASTKILMVSQGDIKALNALAMFHFKKGRLDLSRYLLLKAISLNPKSAELHSNLGIVQLSQNEKRDAVISFRKALEIEPDEPIAATNLGSIYVIEKDFAKAQVALEMAFKKGIHDPRFLNNYAITLTALGKFEKAEELYKLAIKEPQINGASGAGVNKEVLFNYAILLIDRMSKYQDGLDILSRLKFVGGPAESRNKIIGLENRAKAGLK